MMKVLVVFLFIAIASAITIDEYRAERVTCVEKTKALFEMKSIDIVNRLVDQRRKETICKTPEDPEEEERERSCQRYKCNKWFGKDVGTDKCLKQSVNNSVEEDLKNSARAKKAACDSSNAFPNSACMKKLCAIESHTESALTFNDQDRINCLNDIKTITNKINGTCTKMIRNVFDAKTKEIICSKEFGSDFKPLFTNNVTCKQRSVIDILLHGVQGQDVATCDHVNGYNKFCS